MCRADVAPAAAPTLGRLLADLVAALANQEGVEPREVTMGPVDFGPAAGDIS